MMDWFLIFCINIFLLIGSSIGQEYDFSRYEDVEKISCLRDNRYKDEAVFLNTSCGAIISPCFPGNYLTNLEIGKKIWVVNASASNSAPVLGYRFTINEFDTYDQGSVLYAAVNLALPAGTTTTYKFIDRILDLTGNATAPGGLAFKNNASSVTTPDILVKGSNFDIDHPFVYFTFYTFTDRTEKGFNITYCTDFDQCDPAYSPDLCVNESTSRCERNGFFDYSCVCLPGYTGSNCSEDIDECISSPCATNATCTNSPGSYTCDCDSGYTGNGSSSCTDINECTSGTDDCSVNADCSNTEGSFTCACKSGFSGSGVVCNNINECTAGTDNCDENAECTDTVGSFTCKCKDGYTGNGTSCTDIDECADSSLNNCDIVRGSCTNTNGSFSCGCNTGFIFQGGACVDIDECADGTSDCDDNANCTNSIGSFTCECKTGFSGNGTFCADIDECTLNTDNCDGNATCTNTEGSFTCACNSGYTGSGVICNEIDECATNTDNCSDDANCTNTDGGFTCSCKPGYSGDGVTCTDIDECTLDTNNCNARAQCTNTPGSFTCACTSGYAGDGVTCIDIDECDDNSRNNCDSDDKATCTNTEGSFTCSCKTGYSGNGTTCNDIDECTLETNNCNDKAVCTNTEGSFTCGCEVGYTGDGINCADINECTSNTDNCDGNATCTNTVGSFTCACNSGYTGSGVICTDINECTSGTNNCDTNAECTNIPGSFICECNSGYAGDGVTCTDIDECTDGTDNCDANAECTNTRGSFTCRCKPGYAGSGTTCTDINECSAGGSNNCDGNATCTNTDGSFTCQCKDGYTGDGVTCRDINECELTPQRCAESNNTEKCVNLPGSFKCECNSPSYRGTPPNCKGYFCPGYANVSNPTTCTIPGIIEWPTFYDGIMAYELRQTVSWFVNLTGQTEKTAIRFTFENLDVEPTQDYIIFSNSPDFRITPTFAVITGNLKNIFNGNSRASTSDPVGFSFVPKPSYTLRGKTEVYVHFISDRNNVSKGFQIKYEPDVDDCPASNPCANGGKCEDGIFDYNCIDCPGYTGKNCSININECEQETDDCNKNATCTDTVGSYNCTCTAAFTGNGFICSPYIVVSNLRARTESNLTNSQIIVNFDVAEPWGNNPSYLTNYIIILTDKSTGDEIRVRTPSVNDANFLPVTIPVVPNTEYDVSIAEGEEGTLFASEGAELNLPDTAFSQLSGPIAPGEVTDFRVVSSNEISVNFAWEPPNAVGRGPVTKYEIRYIRNEADCSLFLTLGPQEDCETYKIITIPSTTKSYAVSDFILYRNYVFNIRAFTSVGSGDWSMNSTAFTGTVCPNRSSVNDAVANPCTFNQGSLSSDGFPQRYRGFERLFWLIDFADKGAVKIDFDYFNTEPRQDFLDIIQGPMPRENGPRNFTGRITCLPNDLICTYSGDLTSETISVTYPINIYNNGSLLIDFTADLYIPNFGFQIRYITNASQCEPSNPCQNDGTCSPIEFDFKCDCPSLWQGKICNIPRVNIDGICTGTSPDSLTIGWNVTSEWRNDATVIDSYKVTFTFSNGSSLMRPFGIETANDVLSGLTPYEAVDVAVEIVAVNPSTNPTVLRLSCNAGESKAGPPTNFVSSGILANSATFTWGPPDEPNGKVTGYRISYTQTDAAKYGEDSDEKVINLEPVNTVTIFELKAYRSYNFTIAAINGFGEGEVATLPLETNQGVPGPVRDLEILPPQPRSITLTFGSPSVITGVFTYVVTYTDATGKEITVEEDSSPITISDLVPASEYTFRVAAKTSAGPGNAASIAVTTAEDIPGKVSELSVNPASNAITVNWLPPDQPNGVITGYRIEWNSLADGSSSPSLSASDQTFDITSLTSFTFYTITVYASTAVGEGPGNDISIRTLEGAPVGPVQGVNIVPSATGAMLSITGPAVVTGVFTYQVQILPDANNIGIVNTSSPYTVTSLLPYTDYTVVVYPISAGVRGSESFTTTFRTAESTPGPVGNVATSSITSNSITVSWNAPATPNGIITEYRITWSTGGGLESDTTVPGSTTSFTIESLKANSVYDITVYPSTSVGEGEGNSISETTLEGAPTGPVQNVTFTVTATSVTLSITPPVEQTGTFSYNVEWGEIGGSNRTDLDVGAGFGVGNLKPYTRYIFTVFPVSAGTAGTEGFSVEVRTAQSIPGEVDNPQASVVNATAITVTWEPPSVSNGIITGYRVTWNSFTRNSGLLSSTTTSYTINDLQPNTDYNISVSARTVIGEGPVVSIEARTDEAAPTVVDGAKPNAPLGNQQLQGVSPSRAFAITNPCMRKTDLFGETGGATQSISVICKEQSSNDLTPTVWGNATNKNPIPPYITAVINCTDTSTTSARRKRELTPDKRAFIVGFDNNCVVGSDEICNGRLTPGKTYQVAYQATNNGGTSGLTAYSDPYSVPREDTRGLQPGEIAAIVICSVIVLILIILLIVFLIKRRKRSGSHQVSKKGKSNDSFSGVQQPPQQRFDVSPDSGVKTKYSEESSSH